MFIGIDAGGTSTRAVAVDRWGRCIGYGTAGGGNPVSWGQQRAAEAIASAVAGAVRQEDGSHGYDAMPPSTPPPGGRNAPGTHAATLAMAGASSFSLPEVVAAELARAGVPCAVTVESDLLATFCAGTHELGGYALVAGTGAAAVRVADGRVAASADGLGWLLGDGGSGFWLGHHAVRAALAALDGRGPETALAALVLTELGIAGDLPATGGGRTGALQAAVDALYRSRPVELSRFAELVFRAAGGAGAAPTDPVARSLLAAARDRLVGTVAAVREAATGGPVVLGGGIARRLDGLTAAIGRSFAEAGSAAPEVSVVADGVAGAAVLALRHAGAVVDEPLFRRLVASIADRQDQGGAAADSRAGGRRDR